jgi:hypothetical protein
MVSPYAKIVQNKWATSLDFSNFCEERDLQISPPLSYLYNFIFTVILLTNKSAIPTRLQIALDLIQVFTNPSF